MIQIQGFIYGLYDPTTDEIRYVGKCKNPPGRLKSHLQEKGDTRKCRWIASLVSRGLKPVIKVLEIVDKDWQKAEREWIAYFRKNGVDLHNHTDGGEGLNNPTNETRAKIGKIVSSRWKSDRQKYLDIVHSEERCRKISEANKGKPKSPEHVRKLPQNNKGWRQPLRVRQKISIAMKGNQYAKGYKHSDETRARISKGLTGRKYPNRKPWPAETNIKRSLTLKGRPKSEEWKQKLRLAAIKRWSNTEEREKQAERTKASWSKR